MTRAKRWSIVGILAGVAVLLVALASRSGLGISPDSVTYVAAATALADGRGLLSYTGEPLTLFPPGLSVLLAVPVAVGMSAATAALLMNLLCAAGLVVLAYLLGVRTLASPTQAVGAAALVALSPALPETLSMLWTEPLFSVLVTALLLVLVDAVNRRDGFGLWWMFGSAALVWAATSVRYVGLILIVVVFAGAWLAAHDRRRGWRTATVAALLAALGPIALVLRNLGLGAGALGERYPGTQTMPQAVERALRLWGDYLTQQGDGRWALLGGVVVVLLLITGTVHALTRRSAGLVIAVFLLVYWVSIWWSQGTTRIDVISDRLGFPAWVPTVVLAWSGAAVILGRLGRRWAGLPRPVGAVAFLVVALAAGASSVQAASTAGTTGRGYASNARASSPVGQAIAALPPGSGIASDDPWGVWWWRTSGPALHLPPSQRQWPAERIASDLTLLTERVRDGSVQYVAYVDGSEPAFTPEELAAAGFELHPVESYPDGRLFTITWSKPSS